MGNRKETEKKILDAVDRIVQTRDFDSLGINAVAKEAGVGKVLIYRYFGDFQGLVRRWALDTHYWTGMYRPAGFDSGKSLKEEACSLIMGQLDKAFEDSLFRKMLRWHLTSDNPISQEIMGSVEEDGSAVMEAFASHVDSELDLHVLISLLVGGVYYMSLTADRVDLFNGVPLNDEKGRERLRQGVRQWIDLLFEKVRLNQEPREESS